jgi:hypothetical protein
MDCSIDLEYTRKDLEGTWLAHTGRAQPHFELEE